MQRTLVLALVAGALALSAAFASDDPEKQTLPAPEPPAVKSISAISDSELSLYPGSLFQVPNPAGFVWNAKAPGANERLVRAFPLAPPRIPHAIADYVPITPRGNACLDCHALDAGAEAPEIPASHRTDPRIAPGKIGTAVSGARYLCLACHLPTSDAPPARTSRLPEP